MGFPLRREKLEMNQRIEVSKLPVKSWISIPELLVTWSEEMFNKYDTRLLTILPEVSNILTRTEESVTLYKCLEDFLKEERLGPENPWDCPSCKRLRQASIKIDIWRLPEILVIHLKRFLQDPTCNRKLETMVDFPVYDLDVSPYINHRICHSSGQYKLYAISNHYGGLNAGHYTAFVRVGKDSWYEFDDDKVTAVDETKIKTTAAYLLFYQREV